MRRNNLFYFILTIVVITLMLLTEKYIVSIPDWLINILLILSVVIFIAFIIEGSNKRELQRKNIIFILLIIFLFILSKTNILKFKLVEVISSMKFNTITRNMDKKEFDNITYYYSNKKDEVYMENINKYIKVSEEKTKSIFGKTIIYPYNIVIFNTSESFGKEFKVNPNESQAVTILYSLYIPCDNINSYVFAHEYTHLKMNSFCRSNNIYLFKIPKWFTEGVSEYASSTLFPDKFNYAQIEKLQDFKKLATSKQMKDSELSGQNAYMQGYFAVTKIIELKGQDSIQEILINTKSMSFNNAFEKVVGLSIEDFQKIMPTQSVEVLLQLGWKYSSEKKLDKAKDTFLEATEKYPDSELAWHNLALSYTDSGDFDNAIKAREKLISISNNKSSYYFYYSQLFITRDLDKAIAMAEKSAQLAKIEKSSPKWSMNYYLLIKSLKDNLNLDKPFSQYLTLIKSDYIYSTELKIHIINEVLAKYPDKNDIQKKQLLKIKMDLEKQK